MNCVKKLKKITCPFIVIKSRNHLEGREAQIFSSNMQGGRGFWAIYYTSPQYFIAETIWKSAKRKFFSSNMQGGRDFWAIYYTSPQYFI